MADIFLLVGPPAVGKSSAGKKLAAQFERSVHIPVDDVREMVVSGIRLPGFSWDEGLIEQLELARDSVAQMAVTYRRAGFTVVIDDFWDPNSRLSEYWRLHDEPGVHKVLLYPDEQTALERNMKRAGPGESYNYIAGGIRLVYENLSKAAADIERDGWFMIDTTELSVEATVARILEHAGSTK